MKLSFVMMILFVFLCGCDRPSPTKINFNGRAFQLPMRVKEAKKALHLTYDYYGGFNGGKSGVRYRILTQLEGHPVFPGSDNDSEESYYKDYIVGISFLEQKETYEDTKTALEKEYKKKFIPQKKFQYFETKDGLIIALKNMHREQYAVCFYKGIPLDKLSEYVSFI